MRRSCPLPGAGANIGPPWRTADLAPRTTRHAVCTSGGPGSGAVTRTPILTGGPPAPDGDNRDLSTDARTGRRAPTPPRSADPGVSAARAPERRPVRLRRAALPVPATAAQLPGAAA